MTETNSTTQKMLTVASSTPDNLYPYDNPSQACFAAGAAPAPQSCSTDLTEQSAAFLTSLVERLPSWDSSNRSSSLAELNRSVSDGFPGFFQGFVNSTCCYQSDPRPPPNSVPLPLHSELTWAMALQQQALTAFHAVNTQYQVSVASTPYFNSLEQLQALDSNSTQYVVEDTDAQPALYLGTALSSSLFGSGSLFEQDNAAVLANNSGLLYPRTYMMLMYRRDVFTANGWPPPNTWDELIATARALQGSGFAGAGSNGGYGVCLDLAERCKLNQYLIAIAASMIQYDGLPQGLWMDPDTLQPLVNNAAMLKALQILSQLVDLSPPVSNATCAAWNVNFDQGRCAMTLEWDANIHFASRNQSKVKGVLGVAQLPGSRVVLDRVSNTLVPCSPGLCRFATAAGPQPPLGRNGTSRRRSLTQSAALPPGANGDPPLINRAPFSTFGSFDDALPAIGAVWDIDVLADAYKLVYSYKAPLLYWLYNRQLVLTQAVDNLGGTPPRWDVPPAGTSWNLSAQGPAQPFASSDLLAYYPELWKARWHPNPATDMATVGAPLFRVALEEAIHNITALNQPAETVLPVIEARYVLLRTYLNWKLQYMMFQFLESYRRTLGMTPVAPDRPSFPPNPAPPPSASGGGVETSTLVVAIVVPVVVTLLAVLLAVLLVVRSRHLSTSHNKVFAPGMGPDTTLLCTDIQNSTLLWESLDPAVMDMAVSVHHECLQSCMNTHSGYLSAMEGDSFIIAFHNAQSAILFAVDAQLALLQSEWPIELLAAPDCRPEWASPRPDDYLPYSHSCAAAASGGDRSNTRFSPVRRSISNMQTVAALVPVPADDESAGFMRKMSSVIRRSFAGLSDAEPGVPKVPKGESPVLSWSRALGLRRALRGSAREDFFGGERMNSSPVDLPDADIVEFEDPSRRVPAVDPPPPLPLPMPFKSGLLQNLSVRLALGHPKPPPKPLPPPPHRPQVEFGVVQSADSTSSSAAATPMSQHRLLQPSRASQQLTFKPSHPPRVLQPLHSGIAIENMQPGISIGGLLQQHQQQLQQQQQASPARPPPLDKSGSFERLMASANFTFNKLAHVALSVTQPSLSSHRSSVDTTPAVGGGAANATAAAGGGTPCSGVNHLVSPAGGLDTSQRAVLRTLRHSKTGEFDSPIAEPLANGAVKRISGSDRGSEWRNANSPYGGDMGQASPAILSQTGGTADGIVPLSTLGSDARHGMADSFAPPFRLGSGGRRGSNASSISGCMGGFSAFASPGLQAELGLHGVDIVVERSGGSDEDADEGVMPSPFERFQPDLGLGFTLDDNATTSTTSNHHNNHHSDHGGANGDTGGGEDGSKERVTTASRCLSPMRLVSMTWLQLMRYSVEVETDLTEADMGDRKDRVLVHNGIRVRMGLYSGIASMDDIVFNQAAGNVQFSGEPLEAVKAVCSAAGGGMVLLARETYGRLVPQRLDRRVLLLYAGDHHLEESRRHWVLYQAAPVALPQRMAVTDPVKSLTVLQLGTPSAPVGLVTIVFMYVIGASTLLTELPEEARRALALFHTVVTRELLTWRGYLVEAVDGLILAAFSNTASATCWSLACQNLMLEQPWSTELLAHECCEEVFVVHDTVSLATSAGSGVGAEHSGRMSLAQVVSISLDEAAAAAGAAAAGAGSGRGAATASALAQMMSVKLDDLAVGGVRGGALGTAAGDQLVLAVVPAAKKRRVLMRGLRLKIGLDVGRPVPDINTNSGRMQYRGRVMNRAARIASKASAGHVVCSGAAWQDIQENPSNMPAARKRGPLSAESMGMYDLKGIMEPLELFDCRHDEVDSNLQGAGFSGILWRVDEQ